MGLAFVLVITLGSQNGWGQALTGMLTGIVLDSSEAVIPDASVVLRDELSGVQRRTVTNAEGYFTIAAVPTGTYALTVEVKGFAKWERTGIVFNPGDKRHLSDIVLQVGGAAEQVTVVGDAAFVPVDSGEKSAVITAKQIQNITVIGRSAAELIKILPGMSQTGAGVENKPGFTGEAIGINGNGDGGRQSALGYFSANGTRTDAMDIVGDGAHVSDPGCNCATPVNPNPDMIQEFKVLQSNYSAEHAKGPVVLNFVSKSGGRDFHGEGYIYMRQWGWNSNEWLLNRANQGKPHNRYRFIGGNIGGPLTKSREKLFFFVGYENFAQTIDTGVLQSIVPTSAMKQGDFSDAAYMAQLGSGEVSSVPNLGPVIDPSMIDSGGQVLLNLLPDPNVSPAEGGGFNYVQALTLEQPMHQLLSRIDYSISDMTKLFVRYNLQRETQNFPVGLWWRNPGQVPYPTSVVAPNVSDSVSASLTSVFSPTLTNEVVFGLTYINFPNQFEDPTRVSRSALNYPHQGIFKSGLDQIPSITNWTSIATLLNPGGFDPVLFAKKWLISGGDNLTKVQGTHTMKFGAFYEVVTNNQPGSDFSNGVIQYATWSGNSTGNAFADLLTGRVAAYTESNKNVLHNIGFRTLEFYGQDSWRATRRMTIEFGARFAHLGAWYDREGIGLAIFDASRYSNDPADLPNLTGLVWNQIDPSVPLSGAKTRPLFVAPRVGMAYDLFGTGRTVLRGGFGMFRYHDPQGPFPGAIDLAAGHRNTAVCCGLTFSDIEQLSPGVTKYNVTTIDANDDRQPVTYNWSVTVSQRLPAATTMEIAYVGNESRDLTNDGFQNINLVPIGAMFGFPEGTDPNNYRPLQNYGALNVIAHSLFQNYHSLQLTLGRQTGRINYWAAYTWSKAMGIRGGAQGATSNQFDIRENYGPLAYDRTHILNLSYVIQLPEPAKAWTGAGRVLGNVFLDAWQISGITQFSSGVNLQAATNSNFNLGVVGGTLSDGTPFNNTALLGTPDLPLQPVVTCDPREGLQNGQFINGNCFGLPSVGQNGSYVLPYLRGPAFMNHDLSLFKNWSFSETKKLQFRFSAYNFLNHPVRSFTNGDTNLNLTLTPEGQLANPRFGYADSKFGKRILQLALKFFF